MMNLESQLKLQAFLDGELSVKETDEVTAWLTRDTAAQALLNELQNTNGAMAGFEEGITLPESREFYWSKIERQIEREAKIAPVEEKLPLFAWLQRHLVSLGSATFAVCLLGMIAFSNSGKVTGQPGEMELANEKMGAYTFRDNQAQLTMVWLYNHDDSQLSESDSAAKVETE